MPLVFVHGVNTRLGAAYERDCRLREGLLRALLLEPLGPPYAGMAIHDTYWGDLGADFAWGLRSLPAARFNESAQAGGGTELSEAELALAELALATGGGGAEAGGPARGISLRDLAARDLPALIEALLGEIAYDEWSLEGGPEAGAGPDAASDSEADLILAADEAAHDPALAAALARTATDAQAADLLADDLRRRFEARLRAKAGPVEAPIALSGGYESATSAAGPLGRRAEERIRRMALRLPRALGMGLIQAGRAPSHERAARFLGDVFTYLRGRGDAEAPGPIVLRVMEALREARAQAPGEPLLVLTHSMGGNILYDILTHFAPDLELALWCSVGGQVAQFEEMKLFRASEPDLRHPDRVPTLAPRVARWINVYDPADVFSFLAEPVFEGVTDLRYSTGSGIAAAHGAYFRRPSFYRLLREAMA